MAEQAVLTDQAAPATRRRGARAEDIARARRIVHGEETAPPAETVALAEQLLQERDPNHARRLLSMLLKHTHLDDLDGGLRLRVARVYAQACCHDRGARSHQVLSRALSLLEDSTDLAQTEDASLLESAGCLHRRVWELEGQRHHLERALAYYRRSHEHAQGEYKAYAGIQAAFLLDVMSHSEKREAAHAGGESTGAEVRRDEAEQIRTEIVNTLPDLAHAEGKHHLLHDWDYVITLAEAHFGLKRYDEACHWLQRAARMHVPEAEFEATARHFGMLARFLEGPPPVGEALKHSPGWSCLRTLIGDNLDALTTAATGKVGLALSGGGFRAALFHIGVLARLAELDVLRHIEVISCVSGGSIVGAHYYLELRNLLQQKEDADITRQDYIAIVERIQRDLLAGIQENIRMLVAADGVAIVRVIFDRDYSRTVRAGELYEERIYDRVHDDKARKMRDLKITPRGAPANFHPHQHNWRRRAKVPALVLNATTLNTGHNWQFTTTWMGEPPSGVLREIDTNERLRRMYYHQAPPPHCDIRLGKAVTASACVPGIFEPVTLSGLYPKRTVRLVDGGVQDNQGIGGLLDEHCKVLLISDASGQMSTLHDPGTNVFSVLTRSDDISRIRIRAAEYDGLETRQRTSLVHNMMFLHLKKDLDVPVVDWVGCEDCHAPAQNPKGDERAYYGIPKKLQERLSAIRTDLDSFCDQEAYALMLSGYLMTVHEFPRRIEGFCKDCEKVPWAFHALEPALVQETEPDHKNLHRILSVAPFIAFKIWRLAPAVLGIILLLAGLAAAVGWLVAREAGQFEGWAPAAGVVVGFFILYVLARILITSHASVPTPFPELLGFLLWVSSLLVLVEILWYARLLWLWGTGFTVGTGVASWVLAIASAVAGAVFILAVLFTCVYVLTRILRSGKSWSEVLIGIGFIFFLPLANLHLLTYDRWYLWWGRVPRKSGRIVSDARGTGP